MQKKNTIYERILDTLTAHQHGNSDMKTIAGQIEDEVREWNLEQYKAQVFNPEFSFFETVPTSDKKKISIRVEADRDIYKVMLSVNDEIILGAQVLKP